MSNPFICQPMSADEYNQRLDAMIDQHCEDITDELYQQGYWQGREEARDEIRQIIHNIYTQDLYCKADLCEMDEKGYDCEDCLFNAINQTLEGMKETKDE